MIRIKQESLSKGLMPVIFFAALSLIILSLFRLGLYIWRLNDIPDGSFLYVMLQGLRVDFATVCAYCALPGMLLFASRIGFLRKGCILLAEILLVAGFLFMLMNEVATPDFILEYNERPNHIYSDYLNYPGEVITMLMQGHTLTVVLGLVLLAAAAFLCIKLCRRIFRNYQPFSDYRLMAVCFLVFIVTVPMGIRSSLGRRPLNPSYVSFSTSPLANSIPLNSTFSAVYAYLHRDKAVSKDKIYAFAEEQDIIAAFRDLSAGDFVTGDAKCPINQRITPHSADGKKKNVVILLQESLGSYFVGSLGGYPLAPNLERFSKKGWWFTNFYATGDRSRRGIEAVTAGFPPGPMNSIIMLDKTQNNNANIANVFKKAGYETIFMYGGESHFDNMGRYFLGNGVDRVIDQRDFENPDFVSAWGVSDEDLYALADKELTKLHSGDKPFYALIFSSSFHDPFDIPQGRVDLKDFKGPSNLTEQKMLGAKYADYALGKFLDKALKSEYYKDTIFVVVADHEAKVYLSDTFPYVSFHIPALILGEDVSPRVDDRVASQIDLAPTIISLAGLSGEFPYVGQNLLRDDAKERSLMYITNTMGILEGDILSVLYPDKKESTFRVFPEKKSLEKIETSPERLKKAVGLENLGMYIYEKGYQSNDCVRLDTKN